MHLAKQRFSSLELVKLSFLKLAYRLYRLYRLYILAIAQRLKRGPTLEA